MALTKVTTNVIADGAITSAKLDSSITVGTISATTYQNLPTVFSVIGRSANVDISVANGTFTVVGRSANTTIGVT